jgi:hypothetical protein
VLMGLTRKKMMILNFSFKTYFYIYFFLIILIRRIHIMDLVSGFPKNLAYTLKQLSNLTKQTVKVMPDRVNPAFGEVSRFKLPASAMIDFRTISIFADLSLIIALELVQLTIASIYREIPPLSFNKSP